MPFPKIVNRSPWRVSVARKPSLTREFAFNCRRDADDYLQQLREEGYPARLMQLETSFQVRIRNKGFRDQYLTFDSEHQARAHLLSATAERRQGLEVDYAAARRTTVSELIQRYIREECPRHKGGAEEAARLNKLLRDSGNSMVPLVETGAGPSNSAAARSVVVCTKSSRRNLPKGRAASSVQWMNRPLASLTAEDIEEYIDERLLVVAPSTVDREVDLVVAVVGLATTTWRIEMARDPLRGLRRPRYFNERNRRLHPEEEAILFDEASYCESPYVAVAIRLALETAMRRSELLSFGWQDVNARERHVVLHDTKNGRPHRPPLTTVALSILSQLKPGAGPVVAISEEAFKSAWVRLLERCRRRALAANPTSTLFVDLRFHDLRHEALSRLAESGAITGAVDLQAISGHRDPRMLLRYLTLSTSKLAERMDAARQWPAPELVHRGRRRIRQQTSSV